MIATVIGELFGQTYAYIMAIRNICHDHICASDDNMIMLYLYIIYKMFTLIDIDYVAVNTLLTDRQVQAMQKWNIYSKKVT